MLSLHLRNEKALFLAKIKRMRYLLSFILFAILIASCDANKAVVKKDKDVNYGVENDTIRIANDELEYEIIIFEVGFNSFLATQQPRGFYSQSFLEIRNRNFVIEYNSRARNPQQFDYSLYPQAINYDYGTDYGYEVNYMLYNYFQFFMQRYNQKFTGSRQ